MNIISTRISSPPRLLVYGPEGVGKSTFGAYARAAVIVQTEDGLEQIDAQAFPLATRISHVTDALSELAAAQHDYRTVVIDTIDSLERLIHADVCEDFGVQSIEKADGGYGKGYKYALIRWRKILDLLSVLRAERGMCVLLLAHGRVEKFEDPEGPIYDRFVPRIDKNACALVTEWVDLVGYAHRRVVVKREQAGFRTRGVAKAVGADGGERLLRCEGGPWAVAKNRYGITCELPLQWDALETEIRKSFIRGAQ